MFRGLLKVGLVSMLSVGGLSAKTYYTIKQAFPGSVLGNLIGR